ncbi:MAG: class I SAM-dependent methyltransferase [Bacteroidetes bacterium]|nr:class I SAM-dependent methyltransferase [Bacteroidota bacterium]
MAARQIIDGIPCYAPELALSNSGFPPEALDKLRKLEENNFWYRSRNNVIETLIKRFAASPGKFLEVGCGNGFALKALSKFPGLSLTGCEIYLSGLSNAKKRLPGVAFIQLDARNIPFNNEFDFIGCFDVLEHIEDDMTVLQQMNKAVKPGGRIFISVPQYTWLWSDIDVIDNHKRRYSRNELVTKITNAGFRIDYLSGFTGAIFPLMILSRIFRRKTKISPGETALKNAPEIKYPELSVHPALNGLLRGLMRIDEWVIRFGLKLPFGGTLLAVGTKK